MWSMTMDSVIKAILPFSNFQFKREIKIMKVFDMKTFKSRNKTYTSFKEFETI